MRKNYKMQKTISIKHLISELGENFSEHIKERLLDLEIRCVLTRKEDNYILDLKHVEHTKYDCPSTSTSKSQKEFIYGEFIVIEGVLYFSKNYIENDNVMPSPIVDTIYNFLSSESIILDNGNEIKKIDDSNIDYIIDNILSVCPDVSQAYLDIVKEMTFRSENKLLSSIYTKTYH